MRWSQNSGRQHVWADGLNCFKLRTDFQRGQSPEGLRTRSLPVIVIVLFSLELTNKVQEHTTVIKAQISQIIRETSEIITGTNFEIIAYMIVNGS